MQDREAGTIRVDFEHRAFARIASYSRRSIESGSRHNYASVRMTSVGKTIHVCKTGAIGVDLEFRTIAGGSTITRRSIQGVARQKQFGWKGPVAVAAVAESVAEKLCRIVKVCAGARPAGNKAKTPTNVGSRNRFLICIFTGRS